jgi:phosphoribosyl 1,2-cyclic phosphodiesterase
VSDLPSHADPEASPAWEPPALRVLASGSAGNCSVLEAGPAGDRRLCLIDAGLSPRKTRRLLEEMGRSLDQVEDVVVTHLDHDHFHAGWATALPGRALLRLHRRHLGRAERSGLLHRRTEPFDCAPGGSFHVQGLDAAFSPMLASHDSLGVAAFRIEFAALGSSLGFATDVGRVPVRLIEHLAGVDVLAIESNYCPDMQASSGRPEYLKRRIMDGSGHLSNQQCLDAVHEIRPREHVVLLHLSRQCNRPELVAELHAGADYALTISTQDQPTRWVKLPFRASVNTTAAARFEPVQRGLFA